VGFVNTNNATTTYADRVWGERAVALKDLTSAAVLAALSEHDEIGAEAFREKYGFDRSLKYALVHDGKSYDSKAIAGAAHGHIASGWAPLSASQFSGGKDHAVRNLRRLGFEVLDAPRNAPWSRDELILALDLYLSNPASPPGKKSSAVTGLSALLNQLGTLTGATMEITYRNPNGVYMKMMNFRAIDPAFTAGQGRHDATREAGVGGLGRIHRQARGATPGGRDHPQDRDDACPVTTGHLGGG
jgi:hypothetical protein